MEIEESYHGNILKTLPLDEIPKVTNSERLVLFGGDRELLTYYLGIREAAAKIRQDGGQCFCDPRDDKMTTRLKAEGWRPRVLVKDLKNEGDDPDLGLVGKQTALDEDTKKLDSDTDSENEERSKNRLEGEKENKMERLEIFINFACFL